jgi:TonB family protein
MRRIAGFAALLALGCLTTPPPDIGSFPSRAGATWSADCCGEPVVRKDPSVPEAAVRRGESGWVIVSGILDARGWVTDPVVLAAQPPGVFDAAATTAFDAWRYASPPAGARREVRELLRFDVARRTPGGVPSSSGAGGGSGAQSGY